MLLSWLLQILLSELLDVPATIETGLPDAQLNFYDPRSPFGYGLSNHWDSFRRANKLEGDCTAASKNPDAYESCAHVVPEGMFLPVFVVDLDAFVYACACLSSTSTIK